MFKLVSTCYCNILNLITKPMNSLWFDMSIDTISFLNLDVYSHLNDNLFSSLSRIILMQQIHHHWYIYGLSSIPNNQSNLYNFAMTLQFLNKFTTNFLSKIVKKYEIERLKKKRAFVVTTKYPLSPLFNYNVDVFLSTH